MYILEPITLFKFVFMLLILYVISKITLYFIKLVRGVGHTEMITMYSNENWVLYKKDHVRVAGYSDRTGKFIALAYMNASKSVYGHATLANLPWFIIIVSIYAMIGMVYLQFYKYFPVAIAVLFYGLFTIQHDLVVRRSVDLLSE